jgi:hypothetical protein
MKTKITLILTLFFVITSYGQKQINCLTADGPKLSNTINQVKFGTPVCVDVSGVNTFLMSTYSTYVPINFDFSTKGFSEIKIPEAKVDTYRKLKSGESGKSEVIEDILDRKIWYSNKISENNNLVKALELKMITDGSNDIDRQRIEELENEIFKLKSKLAELDEMINKLTKDNEKLKRQYDSIFNIVVESQKFKEEFTNFQKHFLNIDKYTTLKSTLVKQINRDSIFISDILNFKERSKSSYYSVYGINTEHLQQKSKITEELTNLQTSYLSLVSIYQQLNKLYANNVLKLSGELKDGNNVLKFDKITANFESKYLFEDEMAKAKIINDKLMQSENKDKMIIEAQAGIDLYDEIITSKFQSTIISKNVYDDGAKITPELKNSKGKVMYKYSEIEVSTYGNWKVNGSAGYFLNFISDDNYTLRKKIETDSNSKTGVEESNTNTLKHSLGGLLHAYYNFKGSLDAGISVGLSINDNANAGFYFGLSAFITELNRLVITSGVSFNKVKKLNTANLLNSSGEYDFSNESDTEIKYDEVYKPAFFIGITYNLFK